MKGRNLIVITILVIGALHRLNAQVPLTSQYMLSSYFINPAFAGTGTDLELFATTRYQWVSVRESPQTSIFATQYVIEPSDKKKQKTRGYTNYGKSINESAIGLLAYYDKAAAFENKSATFSYSYHMALSREYRLSLGVALGMKEVSVKTENLILLNPNDPILGNYINSWRFTGNAGLLLYRERNYIGLSASDLFSTREGLLSSFELIAGGFGQISHNVDWIPSCMVKVPLHGPAQVDINAKFIFDDLAWTGLSVRSEKSIMILLGIFAKSNLAVGYSIDLPFVSESRLMNAFSHEFFLKFTKNRKKILCFSY